MAYVNAVREADASSRAALEPLVIMLAPYAPHIAEELWSRLGGTTSVFEARWPAFDAKLAVADDVELVVQVNGRVRSRLKVRRGLSQDEVVSLALADAAIQRFVNGKKVRKVVYVQDRLLNLVT
jgi:leucyl-tRNA synthetase